MTNARGWRDAVKTMASAAALTTAVTAALAAVCIGVIASAQQPGAPALQSRAGSADALLGAALHQEEVSGQLDAAIATYRKVLAAPDATRAQKARAQFRIGACYEKLGAAQAVEARKAYEAVVGTYGDQSEFAAQARARLGAMAGPRNSAGTTSEGRPALRQIWPADEAFYWNRVSPDGRQVAGYDTKTGDLVARDLASGRVRRLTVLDPKEWVVGFLADPIWSPDSRFIAASWEGARGAGKIGELLVIDLSDGSARKLPLDERFDRFTMLDWAVDGSAVFVRLFDKPKPDTRRLGAVARMSVSTGAIRPLLVLDPPNGPITAFQSPDGKWVAVREGAFRSAPTLILSSDGTEKRELLPSMDNVRLVGWSPDGDYLLFSNYGGQESLMAVRVVGGRADGSPFVVRRIPGFSSLGITADGRLLFRSVRSETERLHVASFELATRSVGPATVLSSLDTTYVDSVSWSPDGKTLVYMGSDGTRSMKTLAAWSFETRQTRTYSLPLPTSPITQLTWSSDGRSIYARQSDRGRSGLSRIDLVTGAVEAVVPIESGVFPLSQDSTFVGWSPDATRLYKKVSLGSPPAGVPMALVEHRLPDHAERELFRTPAGSGIGAFAVSPDGSTLAFMSGGPQGGLIVLPASGGAARVLVPGHHAGRVYWSADGRFLFTMNPIGSESASMFDVASGSGTRLTLPSDMATAVTLSPDNPYLAFAGGTERKDDCVWLLENFLPPAKAPTPAAPPANK